MTTPNKAVREKEIFEKALDIESAQERQVYLKEACGEDADLLTRVQALLKAEEGNDDFLPEEPRDQKTAELVRDEPGDQMGRYKLLELVGEGGFGAVWAAEQRQPVKRRVALKIIKLGMDTKQVVARFEAERQALALLDHPNIAKVFDAGATETGRPYFVMELVRGIPLIKYCDQEKLSTPERLDLFVQICHAIQHAHQKGIIHRDIKPSNILVTLHDGVAVPKVIDFGIAKATQQELTEKTLYTRLQQFIGTPAYMSPEQAEMSGLDVDTRSDIYSLGALLYELLTGRTPFDAQELMAAGVDQMRRTIREKEPPRPSTRLTQELAAKESVSQSASKGLAIPTQEEASADARRRQRLREQIARLRGDLDWIVMKCLEKDRRRRYETANGLALDIQRHQNNEPILARPPSKIYRFQKSWRRNKAVYAAGMAVAASLVFGMGFSLWLASVVWQERNVARDRAHDLRQEAYAADMKAANVALKENKLGLVDGLLNRYFPQPGDEDDLRGVEWRYLWQASRGDESSVLQHGGMVNSVALSPDGRHVATACLDGQFRVWDRDYGRLIRVFPGADILDLRTLQCVGFCPPEGRLLALGSTNGVQVIDTQSWEKVRQLTNVCRAVAFSPDGRTLGVIAQNVTGRPQLHIYDTGTWEIRKTLATTGTGFSLRLALCRDGRQVVLSSRNSPPALWDIESGTNLVQFEGMEDPEALALSPNGRWLAAGSGDGHVVVWDFVTQEIVFKQKTGGNWVFGLAFSPDSRILATAGADRGIYLWSMEDESLREEPIWSYRGHRDEIWGLAFAPDGKNLASCSKDGTVRLWDATKEPARYIERQLPGECLLVGFSQKGDTVRTIGSKGKLLQSWRVEDGTEADSVTMPSDAALEGLEMHGPVFLDDETILYGTTNGLVRSWHLPTRQIQKTLDVGQGSQGRVLPVIISPKMGDELFLGVWDYDRGRASLWNFKSGQLVWDSGVAPATPPNLESYWMYRRARVRYSPDGRWLASVTMSMNVSLFDWIEERELVLKGHPWGVNCVNFSPDSRLLASGGGLGEVYIWDVNTGQRVVTCRKAHLSGVNMLSFSPEDGRTLFTSGDDHALKFWSVATGREMVVLEDASAGVGSFVSRDGKTLAWMTKRWSSDKIRILRLPTAAEIDEEVATQ